MTFCVLFPNGVAAMVNPRVGEGIALFYPSPLLPAFRNLSSLATLTLGLAGFCGRNLAASYGILITHYWPYPNLGSWVCNRTPKAPKKRAIGS